MNKLKYISFVAVLILSACGQEKVTDADISQDYPPVFPDYVGVTIPTDIAPLNISATDERVKRIDLQIAGNGNRCINVQGKDHVEIPVADWKNLLAESRGDSIFYTVSLKGAEGWTTYRSFGIYVSPDSIDYGLAYRRIAPGYEVYNKMGIYERRLSDYNEKALIENTQFDGCVNCHSFNHCDPTDLSMHVRGKYGATLLRKDGEMAAYNTKTPETISSCVYPYWHPSGKYITYSTNITHQMPHTALLKKVEVFDLSSDVHVYDIEHNKLLIPDALRRDSIWETFPSFSAAGDYLYFCAAEAKAMPDSICAIRYNLCRIPFDAATGAFGEKADTLVNAAAKGKSVSFPRPSYDGRFIMYTLSDYGNFSIWHHEADLWMLDLESGETWPLDTANSDDTESYHSWSSNSRWCVFSSRRLGDDYTRPYICHIDADGTASKPFLLPQKSPLEYYDALYQSYNIPEFINGPVNFDKKEAESIILNPDRKQFGL